MAPVFQRVPWEVAQSPSPGTRRAEVQQQAAPRTAGDASPPAGSLPTRSVPGQTMRWWLETSQQLPRRARESPRASAGAAHYFHHWEAGHLAAGD